MQKSLNNFRKSLKSNGIKTSLSKVFIKTAGQPFLQMQNSSRLAEKKSLIMSLDLSPKDLVENRKLLTDRQNKAAEVKSINWFLPDFEHVLYGGIYTILRFAAYFQEQGIQNRIIIIDNPFADMQQKRVGILKEFPALSGAEFLTYDGNLESLPECDATIATFWTSCFLSVKFNKTKKKFYFIQDYEPLFYPANSYFALAEATYRFGFQGIVNTPGLADFVRAQHGMQCQEFYPCINNNVYKITEKQIEEKISKNVVNIFVYGRPNHDRNAFELAIITLTKLKEKYGNKINIFSAGDDWKEGDFGVSGIIKNLGRLNSLEKVADLYRKSDIGLVFMFTRHPSYQPFEFMACGCAVVSNFNSANTWFLKDNENSLLSEPTPSCILEKVSSLVDDKNLRQKLVKNGLDEVKKHSWEEECEKILQYIKNRS